MPERLLTERQLHELEQRGFTVVPALIDRALAARACQLVDAIVGSPPPAAAGVVGLERVPDDRGQPGPWPAEGDNRPVITSNNWKHSIQHPICDSEYGFAGIMADLATPFVELNQQLLRAHDRGDTPVGGLKLMQQFFRRTDVSPAPHHGCHDPEWVEPRAWHMDQAFLPRHYDGPILSDGPPRQMFYHSILALSPFTRNGGAFFASPTSLQQARALTEAMTEAEQAEIVALPDHTRTRLRQLLTSQIDRSDAVEITVGIGDCILLDPMCVHSASDVATRTRYALFSSFFHEAAIGTTLSALKARVAVAPASKFPKDLRKSLPTKLHGLLEWQLPEAMEEDIGGVVRATPRL